MKQKLNNDNNNNGGGGGGGGGGGQEAPISFPLFYSPSVLLDILSLPLPHLHGLKITIG